jgi:threonine synthase
VAYITGNGLKTQEAVMDSMAKPIQIKPDIHEFKAHIKL